MFRISQETGNLKEELIVSLLKQDSPEIHIILDIDGTLANKYREKDIKKLLENNPHLQLLFDKNLFINAVIPHFLHPGTIEFIQYIYKIPNVKLSFFSSGIEERNSVFAHELLTRSLGNDFNNTKNTVSIYSKQHLVSIKREETENQLNLFKIYHGTMKKDLKKILNTDNLDNVILIDDDSTYVYPGQEKNVFIVPGIDDTPFRDFHNYSHEFPYSMGNEILSMNQIFYITGVLSRIIDMKNNCLADNLFGLQYKSVGFGIYKRNKDLHCEHQYYLDGLAELQKVNPKLEFYGGDLASEHFKKSSFTKKFK